MARKKIDNAFDTRIKIDKPTIEKLDEYIEQRYNTTPPNRSRTISDLVRECMDIAQEPSVQSVLEREMLYGKDVMVLIRHAVDVFIRAEEGI